MFGLGRFICNTVGKNAKGFILRRWGFTIYEMMVVMKRRQS